MLATGAEAVGGELTAQAQRAILSSGRPIAKQGWSGMANAIPHFVRIYTIAGNYPGYFPSGRLLLACPLEKMLHLGEAHLAAKHA